MSDEQTKVHAHRKREPHIHHRGFPNHQLHIRQGSPVNVAPDTGNQLTIIMHTEDNHSVAISLHENELAMLASLSDPNASGSQGSQYRVNASPDTCTMMAALPPHQNPANSLITAKLNGEHVPPCSCGQCPPELTIRWQEMFADNQPPHRDDETPDHCPSELRPQAVVAYERINRITSMHGSTRDNRKLLQALTEIRDLAQNALLEISGRLQDEEDWQEHALEMNRITARE